MPSKKRVIRISAIAVTLLAAGTITAVSVANAEVAETARQCDAATARSLEVIRDANTSADAARSALEAVKVIDLPGTEGWTSSPYADRPAADAVPATETAAEVPARASAAELVGGVTSGLAGMDALWSPLTCTERDHAFDINAASDKFESATATLDEGVTKLTADFAAFQEAERTRVAAEIEAARLAAEQEAARLAAEEAERQRAAEEASRQRASQRGTSGGGTPGSSNASQGGSKPSGPPGGGQVGDGNYTGPVCDNGMGGTRPC